MNKSIVFLGELGLGICTIGLMVLLLNPFHLFMPTPMVMMIQVGILVGFSFFAHFVWKETAGDERDQFHRLIVDRYAYLVGSAVLTLGVVVQGISHSVDPWLVGALGLMILAKVVGSLIAHLKH